MKLIDLTGRRFGKLAVLRRAANVGKNPAWLCRCDCGKETVVRGYVLTGKQHQQGCGCLRNRSHFVHGLSKDCPEYNVWASAKQRCFDSNVPNFAAYGGRGITMCDRWKNDFAAFYADMGPRPAWHSIERRDNNGPYSPDNCYWALKLAQNNNTRRNRVITVNGKRFTLAEACREFGIPYGRLIRRINLGWNHERAVSEAPRRW